MRARVVLINGRFEFINNPDKLEIFDVRNLQKDSDGRVKPVHVVALDIALNDEDAGKTVLTSLLAEGYFDRSEYFQYLDAFLAGATGRNDDEIKRKGLDPHQQS